MQQVKVFSHDLFCTETINPYRLSLINDFLLEAVLPNLPNLELCVLNASVADFIIWKQARMKSNTEKQYKILSKFKLWIKIPMTYICYHGAQWTPVSICLVPHLSYEPQEGWPEFVHSQESMACNFPMRFSNNLGTSCLLSLNFELSWQDTPLHIQNWPMKGWLQYSTFTHMSDLMVKLHLMCTYIKSSA